MLDEVLVDHHQLEKRRREFDEFGYTIIRNALTPVQVQELLATIDLCREQLANHPHSVGKAEQLSIRPVIDKHPVFEKLLIHPATFATVARLLNHYNIQLLQSHLLEAAPSRARRLTGWHSDGGIPAITVNGIRAFGSLKVGYFLRDLTQPNMGSLMVVPGSHRIQGAPPFPEGSLDPIGAVELAVNAGDAVVFQQGLWHAAAPNYSTQTRVALYYGYGYRVFRPVDYQHMPTELLQRCTALQRQLLGETVTHQGYYVPTPDDAPLRTWFVKHFGDGADKGELERVGAVALQSTL